MLAFFFLKKACLGENEQEKGRCSLFLFVLVKSRKLK